MQLITLFKCNKEALKNLHMRKCSSPRKAFPIQEKQEAGPQGYLGSDSISRLLQHLVIEIWNLLELMCIKERYCFNGGVSFVRKLCFYREWHESTALHINEETGMVKGAKGRP